MTIASTGCARLALFLAAAATLLPWAAEAQVPAARRDRPAQVRDVRRTRLSEVVRMTIELDREVPYRSERLDGPPRLVFDFLGARPAASLVEGSLSYHEDVVRYVRIGRHPNDVTRVVFDLAGVRRYSVFALYDPYRLVIDCVREAPAATVAANTERLAGPQAVPEPQRAAPASPSPASPSPASPSPASVAPSPTERVHEPALTPADVVHEPGEVVMFSRRLRATSAMLPEAPGSTPVDLRVDAPAAAVAEAPAAKNALVPESAPPASRPSDSPHGSKPTSEPAGRPAAVPARSERPPAAADEKPAARDAGDKPIPPVPLESGFSLARQLGLGASRIVIDPGHGGRDPGAQARGGSEAAIVLDIALRLEKLLKGSGLDVVLTRRTDRYVALEERTQVANQAEGDLFLSIHANASRNTRAQGVETYVLNFASNPEAEAVAARENASSERTMSSLNGLLQAIALNNKLDESRGFAASVQNALVRRLRASHRQLKDLGVKQAPFVVLIGAGMPSVLVEVSFISHQQEGRLLRTATYRQKVAEALFEGIRGYQKSLKRAMTVSRE